MRAPCQKRFAANAITVGCQSRANRARFEISSMTPPRACGASPTWLRVGVPVAAGELGGGPEVISVSVPEQDHDDILRPALDHRQGRVHQGEVPRPRCVDEGHVLAVDQQLPVPSVARV
jgi:hypothetical protein